MRDIVQPPPFMDYKTRFSKFKEYCINELNTSLINYLFTLKTGLIAEDEYYNLKKSIPSLYETLSENITWLPDEIQGYNMLQDGIENFYDSYHTSDEVYGFLKETVNTLIDNACNVIADYMVKNNTDNKWTREEAINLITRWKHGQECVFIDVIDDLAESLGGVSLGGVIPHNIVDAENPSPDDSRPGSVERTNELASTSKRPRPRLSLDE